MSKLEGHRSMFEISSFIGTVILYYFQGISIFSSILRKIRDTGVIDIIRIYTCIRVSKTTIRKYCLICHRKPIRYRSSSTIPIYFNIGNDMSQVIRRMSNLFSFRKKYHFSHILKLIRRSKTDYKLAQGYNFISSYIISTIEQKYNHFLCSSMLRQL